MHITCLVWYPCQWCGTSTRAPGDRLWVEIPGQSVSPTCRVEQQAWGGITKAQNNPGELWGQGEKIFKQIQNYLLPVWWWNQTRKVKIPQPSGSFSWQRNEMLAWSARTRYSTTALQGQSSGQSEDCWKGTGNLVPACDSFWWNRYLVVERWSYKVWLY